MVKKVIETEILEEVNGNYEPEASQLSEIQELASNIEESKQEESGYLTSQQSLNSQEERMLEKII